MAITLFGSISVPADNGTSALNPTAFANPPIASMVTGDLVFVYAWCRTGSATIAVSNAGGQTWNSFTSTNATGATGTGNAFWCRYNGTWSAAPSFSFGATTNNTVAMMVFRPTASANLWYVDPAKTGSFTQQAAAASFTITGWTPNHHSNVSIGVWCTDDDNTWGTLTGTNWSKTSLTAQYRNVAGQDSSVSFAYQIQTTAAATNNVSQTETALGNDGGLTFGICFYEEDPALMAALVGSAYRNIEQPFFSRTIISPAGTKGSKQVNTTITDTNAYNYIIASGITDQWWNKVDTLVQSLKSNSLWTKFIAIYPMKGGAASIHKWNLKNPVDSDAAFRLSFIGGWTHEGDGSRPNGTTGYADTFIVPATHLTANDVHLSFYSVDHVPGNFPYSEIGSFNSVSNTYCDLRIDADSTQSFGSIQDGFIAAGSFGGDTTGHFLVTRRAFNDLELYKNASSIDTDTSTSGSVLPVTYSLYLGARNVDGTALLGSTKKCGFATIGSKLTAGEVSTLYTIIQTFLS